jgi:hypothetical protein
MVARLPSAILLPSQALPVFLATTLFLLLGFSRPASAGTVLVLGFVEEGKPNARVRQSVIQFLQRMGEEVVGVSLPASEQLCTQTDCMVRLGEHYQAQRLIGGDLIPNDTSYRIMVWLFDRVSELPNSAESVCTDCNPELLADTVARMAGQALELPASPVSASPPAKASSLPTSPPPVRCVAADRTFGRGVGIGSLTALTTAGLVTGLVLAGEDGRVFHASDGMNEPALAYHLTSPYQLAFSLTAVSAAGLIAAALPWRRIMGEGGDAGTECRSLPRNRWSFGRGVAIGALGTFTLLGLVSAFTLTGMNGSVAGSDLNGMPIPYDFRAQYTAASVVSAGMIVGLGLAIFLR